MRVGILGGTFNPPHIGHLLLAEGALAALKLSKILFIPTNIPVHKSMYRIGTNHRLNMVKRAISKNPHFVCCDIEIKRGGPSFTIDTLRQLKKKMPRDTFFLIIGSELANDFSTWKDPKGILSLATVAVAERANAPLTRHKKGFVTFDIAQVGVNSSLIRRLIKKKRSVRYLLPESVLAYITQHRLYRT